MKDGYWKGHLSTEEVVARVAHGETSSASAPDAIDDAHVPPDAPLRHEGEAGPYWQAAPRSDVPSGDAPVPAVRASGGGSVSASARRAYAAEALRQKDHVAAGLLAIFLGVFGIHKFYLGCNQAGFLTLAVSIIGGIITLGLAAAVIEVISIIEGIIYLTKSQTEFDRIYVLNQRDWF